MRKSTPFLVLVIFILFSSCEKRLFDYRNKYTGDFNFVYSYTLWDSSQGAYDSGNGTYSGRIFYDKKTDGEMMIAYNESTTLKVTVNANGEVLLPCGTEIGAFEGKNKIVIEYSTNSCPGTSSTSGTTYHVEGDKK